MSSIELCSSCRDWGICMFTGYSPKGLQELQYYGRSDNCPQFPTLLQQAEAKAAGQIVFESDSVIPSEETPLLLNVENVISMASIESEIESAFQQIPIDVNNTPHTEDDAENDFLQEDIVFDREDSDGKEKVIKNNSKHRKRDKPNVTIGLRAYIDAQDYLEKTKVPEYLWGPFQYIMEAIDNRRAYITDLSEHERIKLNNQIHNILYINDISIHEEDKDVVLFMRALTAAIYAWTKNTKGKSKDEIHPFMSSVR